MTEKKRELTEARVREIVLEEIRQMLVEQIQRAVLGGGTKEQAAMLEKNAKIPTVS